MKFYFFKRTIFFYALSNIFGSAFFGIEIAFLFSTIGLALVLFFNRKAKVSYQERVADLQNFIFAPVTGKVKKVHEQIFYEDPTIKYNMIEIIVDPWDPQTILSPCKGEIIDRTDTMGKRIFRYKYAKKTFLRRKKVFSEISLAYEGDHEVFMRIVRPKFAWFPSIAVMPGDRVKKSAEIGQMMLGAIILLYLPVEYKIVVRENSSISASETILAKNSEVNSEKKG